MAGCQLVETARIGAEQAGHLVDKGPCAARARFVHAQFHILPKVEQLGVFAAKLYGHGGIGRTVGNGAGGCQQLLHKKNGKLIAEIKSAGACHGAAHGGGGVEL